MKRVIGEGLDRLAIAVYLNVNKIKKNSRVLEPDAFVSNKNEIEGFKL